MTPRFIRNARIDGRIVDVAIERGRIAAIGPDLGGDGIALDAAGMLVVPGLIETHLHLDKTCILDRCAAQDGSVAEAIRETARAKRDFTPEDVAERAARTLRKCIAHGTTHIRTHVELDPGIGMRGFEGVLAARDAHAWALDIELCVFPQEGLTNNPGTEELLIEGLRRGARAIGAVPYADPDPRGQLDRIFRIAADHDVAIDMHLDLADTTRNMQIDYVADLTERYGWGGRVTVGHVTQLSLLPPAALDRIARRLADVGIAVTVLPSTDLFLMGRDQDHAVRRGVVPAHALSRHGVTCSISTNNVLNPFTPYGDGSLIRMANLYANVCHLARGDELAGCLGMITTDSARLLGLTHYGLRIGAPADMVVLDAIDPAGAVAELAEVRSVLKNGVVTVTRPPASLHRPA